MAHEKKQAIQKRLEKITKLPTLPAVLDQLRSVIRDPLSGAKKFAKIVEDDPALMARILKVVNSPLYAATEPIENLQLAITRLGMKTINNIALSASVLSVFGKDTTSGFDPREFWKHSICAGIGANVVYDRCEDKLGRSYTRDQIHLAGLLHDIGKIIFHQHFHDDFQETLSASWERQIPLFQMELELMEADHAQVGAWLGEKWHLAPELIEAIRWHHEPDGATEAQRPLVMLCHVANYVCNREQIGNSGDSIAPAFFKTVWTRLGIEENDIQGIVEQIKLESQDSEILLSFV